MTSCLLFLHANPLLKWGLIVFPLTVGISIEVFGVNLNVTNQFVNIQIMLFLDIKCIHQNSKLKQLTERGCREWKLSAINPHDRRTWRSGVRSAMCAASHLSGRGPLMWMLPPVPAR